MISKKAFSDSIIFTLPLSNYYNELESQLTFMRQNRYSAVIALCSRNPAHSMEFFFVLVDTKIIKIGQYPSIADISTAEIKKYHTMLGNEKYRELNRAVGLYSHGIGIGSFVYLRRIFEGLIEEAHIKAKITDGGDDDAYYRSRMAEKISRLESYLPTFLVDNKGIYSILSKGIHELSEQECLEMFPVLKLSIELILDEKLLQKERESKTSLASKAIQSLIDKIN
jgi:hypothetical protein